MHASARFSIVTMACNHRLCNEWLLKMVWVRDDALAEWLSDGDRIRTSDELDADLVFNGDE